MRKTLQKMFSERRCYGWILRFSNGRFYYQNDNDLGFAANLSDYGDVSYKILKKIPCGKGFVYYLKNDRGYQCADDGTGTPLKTTLALLHECHEGTDPLSKHEQMLCKRYWEKF